MFEIYKDKPNEFRFRLKAKNGDLLFISEIYTQKKGCESGIETTRKSILLENAFDIKVDEVGVWSFNLKASNGQLLARSESYNSKKLLMKIIETVKSNTISAPIKEVTK